MIDGVLLVPESKMNLVSVHQLTHQYGVTVEVNHHGKAIIRNSDGVQIGECHLDKQRHVYVLEYLRPAHLYAFSQESSSNILGKIFLDTPAENIGPIHRSDESIRSMMPFFSSSSVRLRPTTGQQPQLLHEDEEQGGGGGAAAAPPPPPPNKSTLSQALTSTANLATVLPTGTLLALNLLSPIFTNHGACDATMALLTRCLLAVLALSCVLASFTDSVKGPDGRVYYGVATPRGLWLIDYPPGAPLPPVADTSRCRLAFIDFVHAALSAAVFGVVAARDKNVVKCFCPTPARETEEVLDILPLGVGVLCSLLFVAFPTRRHGIGYPVAVNNGS
jgi:hypothetical protein